MNLTAMTLALSLLSTSPSQAPNVTFAEPPQSIESALSKIGASAGEKLTVSQLLAREVVQITVKDVPYEDLLTKIGTVAGGVWVKTADGRRLDLDTDLAKKEAQEALTERTAVLKAEIDKLATAVKTEPAADPAKLRKDMEAMRESLQNGENPGPAMQMFGNMNTRMPSGRAVVQTVAAMRPEDLAKIEPGQRVVFTTMPTPMQKPLPSTAVAVMRSFAAEQAKWDAATAATRGNRGRQNGQAAGSTPPTAPQVGPPYKAFLIATRFGEGLMLQYAVTDAQGHSLGTGNLSLGNNRPQQPAANPTKSEQKPLKLSPESRLALDLLGRGGGGGGFMRGAPGGPGGPGGFGGGPGGGRGPGGPGGRGGDATPDPRPQDPARQGRQQGGGQGRQNNGTPTPFTPPATTPELLALIKDPVANEPIAITLGDVWTQVANAEGKNFVALLPDSLINTAAGFLRTDRAPAQILEAARTSWNLKVASDAGWVTIEPKSRLKARAERIDRSALKTLIEAIGKKGAARLDDVAIYATRSPVLSNGSFDIAIVRAIDPSAAQEVGQVYGQNRNMLLIFAGIGNSMRQALGQGKTAQVTSVSNNALALVADMVYNSNDGPRVAQQEEATAQTTQSSVPVLSSLPVIGQMFQAQNQGQQPRQGRQGGGRGDMTRERTEILPRGVPTESVVVVATKNESVAKAVRKDAGMARVMTSQMMGFEKAMAANPQPNGAQGGQGQRPTIAWDGYIVGNRYQYTFVFTLAKGVTLTRTLEDSSFDPNAKPVTADKLPAEFLAEVNQAQKVMEDRRAQMAERFQQGNAPRGQARGGRQTRQRPPGP